MNVRDLRPWFVNDPIWTRGYVPPPNEDQPSSVTVEALERLLDSAAVAGDSAYVGLCFDLENNKR